MIISPPFLTSTEPSEDNEDSVEHAFTGHYPVTSYLDWHNGLHLIAPQENGYVDARAIADGKVIYVRPADDKPSTDPEHAQNYAAYGGSKEWSDRGMVILEHQTEIGAKGDTPTVIVFYSVYAHLKEIGKNVATGKSVSRKDSLGKPGQIYGYNGHMHFEICMDNANLQKLLGQDPMAWPNADARPTKDGRTDVVFGSIYIYVSSTAAVQSSEPSKHLRIDNPLSELGKAQWVQIEYNNGSATLTSYTTEGVRIGSRTDANAEYELYAEANKRHNSLSNSDKVNSSPSAWYELLRFGRNIGRGDSDSDKDPLPIAAHWRKICTPSGEQWVDLNGYWSYKFSDADFPAFMGWTCIADDKDIDQFCNSVKLKALLTQHITDPDEREAVLKDVKKMGRLAQTQAKTRLRRAICKYPTEFDQTDIYERYSYIKEEAYFKENEGAWDKLFLHIATMTCVDLPEKYKDAQWHFHPLEFINVMKKCGWLSKGELVQCIPSHAVRTGQWKDARNVKHPGVFWEKIIVSPANLESGMVAKHYIPLNRTMRKYGINTPLRKASFFGNAIQESTWLSTLTEGGGSGYWYAPWFGRGFLQLTHPSNYFNYWEWRGRTVNATLKQLILAVASREGAQQPSRRSLTALADSNFSGMTQQIKDWRAQVNGGARSETDEEKLAPSDSAGFYWISIMIRHADAAHALERVSVATVDSHGTPTGNKVYYRSPTFWKVSAAVNLPSAVNHTNYSGINGFDSRCSGYGAALAALTEMRFPGTNGTTLDYPEGYTPRR